jgi:hypothetical protein
MACDAVLTKYYDHEYYLPWTRSQARRDFCKWVVLSHAATLILPDKPAAVNALAGQAEAAWGAITWHGPPGLAVSTPAAIARVSLLQELFEEPRPHKVFEYVKTAPQLLSRSVDHVGVRTDDDFHILTIEHPKPHQHPHRHPKP